MKDQVINSNLNKFTCVLLKLVSGEEIICHVDPRNMAEDESIVLYDPLKLEEDDGTVVARYWMYGATEEEFVIDRTDIMSLATPKERFKYIFEEYVMNKYDFEEDYENGEEDVLMEMFGDTVVMKGSNSIN